MLLFLHPTLRDLTISCANTDEANIDIPFEDYRGRTPLRRLTLIECNISAATMEAILSLPSILQSLDITSRRNGSRIKIAQMIHNLVVYQPKLESLTYTNALEKWSNGQLEDYKADISSLSNLKHLALPYDYNTRYTPLDPLIKCIASDQGSASLETVMIGVQWDMHDSKTALSYHRKLGLHLPKFPQLRTLIVFLGGLGRFERDEGDFERKQRPSMEALKKGLQEDFETTKVRIIVYTTYTNSYVPPYLYGEKAPSRLTTYDSGAEDTMAK